MTAPIHSTNFYNKIVPGHQKTVSQISPTRNLNIEVRIFGKVYHEHWSTFLICEVKMTLMITL